MKKIILLLLLVLVSVSASARKSYITVCPKDPYYNFTTHITGDVPDDINSFEYDPYYHFWVVTDRTVGEILNILSEYGYEVESMIEVDKKAIFLLSKEVSSSNTQIKGDVNTDGSVNISDVNEVISLILGKLRDNPNLLEELGIEQPK